MRTGSDPLTEDPAELDARADEAAREQRWYEFVRNVVLYGHAYMLRTAANMYEMQPEPHAYLLESEQIVMEFQRAEGWSGVLSAIARAMREQATNGD